MKHILRLSFCLSLAILLLAACEEESDMAFDRVESPVFLQYDSVAPDQVQATFFDLDKSGILDEQVGIQYLPIEGMEIEVSHDGNLLGTYTTNAEGSIIVQYSSEFPHEFAGSYDETAFRIFKNGFD
ncbi:hypothetical protein PZB74_16705 [Porifericola rhodea]|uniref:hypothetical protein n=1 Tax=Porifericola rhodea TaxID=930972 RepID=UPI002665FA3C|nr:hypothetical protein [Porifericola rhodea]WKN30605.1 hypothetical protein PZB74_16705 [Porifericola rhodea]